MRFHLSEPIDFQGMPEADKQRFSRHAVESHGLSVKDLTPDSLIEVLAFSSEAECREEYERVRGDKQGPALTVSGAN